MFCVFMFCVGHSGTINVRLAVWEHIELGRCGLAIMLGPFESS